MIVTAVENLPADLDPALVEQAETHLVAEAAHHDPRALRILGSRLLEVIDPDTADAHEAKLLEREEAAGRGLPADDGRPRRRHHPRHLHPPDDHRGDAPKALLAIGAPKHRAATDGCAGERRPGPERMGRAFCEYVERYPADRLPNTGGLAATVVVTMTLETLMGGLKAAHLDTGARISPGAARRMACQAGIIPIVLDGKSEVLDVGRQKRFHTKAMRIAMSIRDQGCTTEGCDWPPGLCHAHHDQRWATAATPTSRPADSSAPATTPAPTTRRFTMTKLPGGKVAFTTRR